MFYIINRILNFCHKSHSFSLVELAVVLSVAGILIGGGLTAYKSTNPKIKSDLKKMQAIEEALQQFFNTNGRLPFPANPAETITNQYYLTEAKADKDQHIVRTAFNASQEYCQCYRGNMEYCSTRYYRCVNNYNCCPNDFVLWGTVPTKTLGLPDDYAYDSYGHNFEYITHYLITTPPGFIAPDSAKHVKKTAFITNQAGQYLVDFINIDGESYQVSIPFKTLSIYNNATGKQIETTKDNTAYVLLSKGSSGKCYFNTKTSNSVLGGNPTGNLLNNCVSHYADNSNTERTIYQGYSKSFNNIVKYKTVSELISTASRVEETAKNIGSGLTSTANKKAICEAMYPVGSVYMNAKDSTNPQTLLGCGTWQAVTKNNYLMSVNPSNNSTDYDAYNNAYGNFAGTYLNECLPNIKGWLEIGDGAYWGSHSGGFETHSGDVPEDPGTGNHGPKRINFDASAGSVKQNIYLDSCFSVRPKSYGAYMWVRTS